MNDDAEEAELARYESELDLRRVERRVVRRRRLGAYLLEGLRGLASLHITLPKDD